MRYKSNCGDRVWIQSASQYRVEWSAKNIKFSKQELKAHASKTNHPLKNKNAEKLRTPERDFCSLSV